MTRPDHGAWVVAGKRYLNKLQAVTDAVRIGHWIHWDFHDDVFGGHDWTKCPQESLDFLYQQRARTLRERYSHLVLEFSGGSDSWNALYSFAKAGLHVDTVIHRYAGAVVKSATDLSPENKWAEGKFQAWPAFQYLQQLDPNLKWTTWDVVEPTFLGWEQGNLDIFRSNAINPGSVFKLPELGLNNPTGVPDLPTTGWMAGVDKPCVEYHDGCFYLTFYDYAITPRGVLERTMAGQGFHDILFYWDPECLDLMTKQAHVVMNFFIKHPHLLYLLSPSRGHDRDTYYSIINALIYPAYKERWTPIKNANLIAVEHENYFIDQHTRRGTQKWRSMVHDYSHYVECLLTGTPFEHWIKKDGKTDISTLPACPSKRYLLGHMPALTVSTD